MIQPSISTLIKQNAFESNRFVHFNQIEGTDKQIVNLASVIATALMTNDERNNGFLMFTQNGYSKQIENQDFVLNDWAII